jgi:hypothetical protein
LPRDSYQIRDPSGLPPQLQQIVASAAEQGHVWTCWANDLHTWLFTGEMSLPLSRERGAPVLKVCLYDEAGELKDAGTWVTGPQGAWCRCSE